MFVQPHQVLPKAPLLVFTRRRFSGWKLEDRLDVSLIRSPLFAVLEESCLLKRSDPLVL